MFNIHKNTSLTISPPEKSVSRKERTVSCLSVKANYRKINNLFEKPAASSINSACKEFQQRIFRDRRSYMYLTKESFLPFYKGLLGSNIKYANSA